MTNQKLAKFLDIISYSITLISVLLIPIFLDKSLVNSYIIPKGYVFSGLVLLNVILWSIKSISSRTFKFRHTVISWPVFSLMVVAGVSSLFSLSSQTSFLGRTEYYVLSFFSIFFFVLNYFILVNQLNTKSFWKKTVDFLVVSGVIVSLIYLLKTYFDFGWLENILANSSNTVENSGSIFSVFIASIFILSVGRLVKKNNSVLQNILNITSALVLFATLVSLAYSFIWWLLLVGLVLLLVLGISFIQESRLGWLSGLFAVLLTVGIFIIFGSPQIQKAKLPTEISLGLKPSWDISSATIFSGTKNFILGSGPGTFVYDFSKFRTSQFNNDSVAWNLRFTQPINTFFSLIAEFGSGFYLLFLFVILFYVGHVLFVWYKMKYDSSLRGLAVDLLWKQNDIRFDVFIIAIAWFVSTVSMVFVFAGFVNWWLWWLLLSLGVSGLGFINTDIIKEVELEMETTPQYNLAFSFTMIVVIAGTILFSILGVRSYAAEVYYADALSAKNLQTSERKMLQAIEKKSSSDVFHMSMAQIYLAEAGELAKTAKPDMTVISALVAKAVNEAKIATDLSPASIVVWENMATMYENAAVVVPEAREWAIKSLIKCRELEPSNAILAWKLANNYLQSNKIEDAINLYREAIKLKSDYLGAYIGLANTYEQNKQIDKAVDVYKMIFNQSTENPEYLFNFGRLLYNRNVGPDRTDAEKLWLKAVAIAPNYSDALYSLGLLYETRGNKASALEYYNKVKELNPENKDVVQKIKSLSGLTVVAPAKKTIKKK